MSQSSGDIQGL